MHLFVLLLKSSLALASDLNRPLTQILKFEFSYFNPDPGSGYAQYSLIVTGVKVSIGIGDLMANGWLLVAGG